MHWTEATELIAKLTVSRMGCKYVIGNGNNSIELESIEMVTNKAAFGQMVFGALQHSEFLTPCYANSKLW